MKEMLTGISHRQAEMGDNEGRLISAVIKKANVVGGATQSKKGNYGNVGNLERTR
jgi:hypothetical protein